MSNRTEKKASPASEPVGVTPELFSASLANCEREPIHIPGSIQPQGALLGFDPTTGAVLYASTNLNDFLSRESPLLNTPSAQGHALADLLGAPAFARVQQGLIHCGSGLVRHELVELAARPSEGQTLDLDGLLHVHRGVGVLEIEARPQGTQADLSQRLSETIDALRSAVDLDELCNRMAQRVKHLTNFDRVMVYRFDEHWDGHVVADVHEPDMESFYDLHYPASDIPAQARELYCSNLVRYIADMSYRPVPVLPLADSDRLQPLDMSHASLRSVSPMHVQYMRNMGVASTLTISLLVDNRLWGLIACHHRTATAVPIKLRRACYSLAVTAGYMTGWFVEQQRQSAAAETRQAQARIVEIFNQVQVPLADVIEHSTTWLLRLVGATGGALWRNDGLISFGHWPAGARGDSVMRYLRRAFETRAEDWLATEELRLQPPLADDEMHALCGLLAVRFDAFANSGIVWLRPETRRGVSWGGDPDKPVQVEINNGQPVLSPRLSFARWTTLVKGRSRTWTDSDRDAARSLLVLQQVLIVRDSLAQVHVSDRQFRSLVALQSEAYWQLDQDGRVVTMSKRLPFAHGPLHAARMVDVFAEFCSAADVLALSDALDSGRPFRGLRLRGRDHAQHRIGDQATGNAFVVSLNGEPMREAAGSLTGWHGTLTDVTHEAKIEQAMQQKAAAELASQTKSNFLSQISHELRTPLNVIIGFSQLSLLDVSTTPQQRDRIQQVFNAGNWLLTMIADLLDLSRIESGRLRLTMTDVDVNALLQEAVGLLQPQADEQSIRIVLPSFDQSGQPKRVRADVTRLKQVLVNLLSNAIKYNRPQGEVRVEFSAEFSPGTSREKTRIEVSDTGDGLTKAQLEHLFEPFNRLGRESQKVTGTGIGLVIAKELVEHMGGAIEVKSTPGIGSCFAVVLDTSDSEAEAIDAPDGLGAENEVVATASAPPLVLYVEDETGSERLMRELTVNLLGFRYNQAATAEAGLELARAIRPNVMLIDRNLPGQDGSWLLRALRAEPTLQSIPCIAVTADATEQTRVKLLDEGFDQVWHKPIDVAAVCRALKNLAET